MTGLPALAILLLLGIGAQWLAWRLRLPSILLLLCAGFFAGPEWLGWVDTDRLLGDLLFPLVAAAVGVVLFEGGLGLNLADLKGHGKVVLRLVTVGALVTWALATALAYGLLGLPLGIAVLLGAILIVSGPTVVGPLLRHIHPRGPTGSILTWEGILIDPVGALMAVLVYEGLSLGSLDVAAGHGGVGVLLTLLCGGGGGVLGGLLLVTVLRRHWVPETLLGPVTLALVVGLFAGTNLLQEESGLLAVTAMGVVAANLGGAQVRPILEFKENLRVLLISLLFVLLAARLTREQLSVLDARAFAFLGALLLVVRPLAALVCTWGTTLTWKERVFVAWLCPRGIVAAAVASVFGLALVEQGVPGAEHLLPVVFLVIVGTVVVYGLTAPWLARRLGLSVPDPQGCVFVGAQPWARAMAAALGQLGVEVLLIDTNRHNVRDARLEGLEAHQGNVLDANFLEHVDLTHMGRVLALTPNDEVNTLVCAEMAHEFGRRNVYQIATDSVPRAAGRPLGVEAPGLRGRRLFAGDVDAYRLARRFAAAGRPHVTPLTEQFTYEDFRKRHGDEAIVLFSVSPAGRLQIDTADTPLKPERDARLVAFIPE